MKETDEFCLHLIPVITLPLSGTSSNGPQPLNERKSGSSSLGLGMKALGDFGSIVIS